MLATEPLVVEERAVPTDSDEYRRFAIDHPVRAREAEWARQAVMRDFNRLMESRSVALKRESDEPSPGLSAVKWDYNRFMESLTVVPKLREELKRERDEPFPEMGMPIDPSVRGPLGPLWEAGCVPKWFQEGMDRWRPPRAISVATGSEFLAEIRSVATFPDIVCWYLRPDADLTELENLEGALTRVQSESRSLGRIRPVFSVYAPGIEEGRRLRLIDLGANVYYEPWDEWFKPTDAESFGKMIKDRYQETYRGWKSDDRGLWTCVDARVGWRSFGRRPSLARAETPSGAEAASCQATRTPDEAPKVSSEDYRQLLEYLYSEDSSEAEY